MTKAFQMLIVVCLLTSSCSSNKSKEEPDPTQDGYAVCQCYYDVMEANGDLNDEECDRLYRKIKERYIDNQEAMVKLSDACGIFLDF